MVLLISSIYGWISLGIGVIVLSVFINHELKTSNALYDFRLLKNKNYAIDNYVALVISLTAFALPYFYGLYFQYYRLCTPSQAGLLVLMYGLFYILSNLIITKIYNHIEIKRLYKVSMGIQPLIVLILIFSNNLYLELIIGLICLSAFLNGFADVLNRSFVLGVYGEEKISDTSSFLSTARNYGDLIITGIITYILSIIPATSHHFAPTVMIAVFIFMIITAVLLYRKVKLNRLKII